MWRVRGVGVRGGPGWWRGLCSEAEVRVFWDLNRCGGGVAEVHSSHIAPNIVQALRSSGFWGPVSIHAYGNTRALSHQPFLHSLLATGVDLHHIPGAMKDLSNHLLLDLLFWVKGNPPPAHMLLISGDKEYSSIMHKLHMRGYNVLLAHPEGDISPDLLSAASKVWVWDNMMKGTELVARTCKSGALPKTLNLVHTERVLTRPFNHMETQFSVNQDVQAELDSSSDHFSHGSKNKPQNIPKEVVKQVVDVIRLRPSGFTLGAFRRQLGRSNVVLDKDFYGHKDLLSFLLSVPELKVSLVWTTDKTRTYLFTENFSGSKDNGSKGTVSARCDCSKDFHSPKHEVLQVEEEAKPHKATRIESVLAFQQFDNRSGSKEHSKEHIAEKLTINAAESPGFVADCKNVFSNACRKVLSKSSHMIKILEFAGVKAARADVAISETPPASKDMQSKLKIQCVDSEACRDSATSQNLEEEGEQTLSAQNMSSKETLKGIESKTPKRILHDDVKGCNDCTTSNSVQENREKQSMVVETLEENGEECCFPERELKSNLQGQENESKNAIDTVFPVLQVGECTNLKETLKDTRLEKQLCEDVLSYLLNEGRIPLFTRATTMEDVLKCLMESDPKGICAQLEHEELMKLAQMLHGRAVTQVHKCSECDTGPRANDDDDDDGGSLMRALMRITFMDSEEQVKRESMRAESSSQWAEVERDVKGLLQEAKGGGMPLASLKPLFKQRYGYELNHKALGHVKLVHFISSLEDVKLSKTISGGYLLLLSSHGTLQDAHAFSAIVVSEP